MVLGEIKDLLEAEVITGDALEKDIQIVCACDLLSNVLRCVRISGSILLTSLTHPQTVRVADMVDATAICFLRNKKPQDETITLAKEKGIILILTKFTTYEASGRVYQSGLPGCTEIEREY